MRMGIMQPYFFPYLGYFSLIASVDKWIVFDVTQYTPKTWMNRNRILHPNAGWQYVTVPLSNSSINIETSEARALDLAATKKAIIGKLAHYKRKAPYFDEVKCIVERAFDDSLDDSLVGLNVSGLNAVCSYLEIPFSFKICSKLTFDFPTNIKAGGWAPYICQKLGASEYVNPIGGKEIFDRSVFQQNGITLYFAKFDEFKYATPSFNYEPNLSILDVMMWNSAEDIVTESKNGTHLIKAT